MDSFSPLVMPFVFYFITDTFPSVAWTRSCLYACLYKVWNHLDATYCEFSLTIAKEKYKSIGDSKLCSHVGLYYASLLKLKIDDHWCH